MRHIERVSSPSAGNEQQTPFSLRVLFVGGGVLGEGGDRCRRRYRSFVDADHGDTPKLQALHAVHGSNPNGVGCLLHGVRDAGTLERLTDILYPLCCARGDADSLHDVAIKQSALRVVDNQGRVHHAN